ncbi:DUF4870 domain-containing protein [Actinoplanes subglobosus]|uniref:DUF4870 domain-containing protein n=1 Tax=Actinoplanes subglobosus TaxID=1547892 RepID=A0ABV8IHJ1_9ACTN
MGRLPEPSVPEPDVTDDPLPVPDDRWTAEPVPDDVVPARAGRVGFERFLIGFAHWGGVAGSAVGGLLGWVAPLIALAAAGWWSPDVRRHAVAALNFHLTWLAVAGVVAVVSVYTNEEPELVPYIAWIFPVSLGFPFAYQMLNGERDRYPGVIRFLR